MNQEWLNQNVNFIHAWRYCYRTNSDAISNETVLTPHRLDQYIDTKDVYKNDLTTTVVKVSLDEADFVLKRYNPRSFGHKIKRALRRSRASRCWSMSYAFARAGLRVPTPVFMYELRFGILRKSAYFANEFLDGEELLTIFPMMSKHDQMSVVSDLKVAMDCMRESKISHGDMKASNLLWVQGELFFIDLDAAKQHRTKFGWQLANKRDKKRFLKNWRDQPELLELFSWLK